MPLFDQSAFHRLAGKGADTRRAGVSAPRGRADGVVADESTRTIRFCLSDDSVDRVGDTINPDGWKTGKYMRNPVVLWAHDSHAPPIGRMCQTWVFDDKLMGDVEFIDAETYAFADTVFRMVVSGYISAGSVGFLPIKWRFSSDASRPGGSIDFLEQELLEFSICPVPANSNALVAGKRMGLPQSHLRRLGAGFAAVRRSAPRRISPQQAEAMLKVAGYRFERGSPRWIAELRRISRLLS